MPPDAYPLLGSLAVAANILSEPELEDVLRKAADRGLPLGEMLYKLGYLTRERLVELLAEQYGTTVYELQGWRADAALLEALPGEFVREYGVMPVSLGNGRIVIAASGPFHIPLPEILARVAELTGCRAEAVICEETALRRYLAELFPPGTGDAAAATLPEAEDSGLDAFSSLVGEIRAEAFTTGGGDAAARAELEESLDRVFAQLSEARGHPFAAAVDTAVQSAAELLDKTKQYEHTGMYSEAMALLQRAQKQLDVALRKAEELQEAWGPLLQHVELLRTRIAQLEAESAADYAPQEMTRLLKSRDDMRESVEAKAVERLRALVDEAQVAVERIESLSPQETQREQLLEHLTEVREVLTRARRLGAQSVAPDAIKAAYRLLDDAGAQARDGAWDQVHDMLMQAEAHAEAAEAQALMYAQQRQDLETELRDLCDTVAAGVRELYASPGWDGVAPGLAEVHTQVTDGRMALAGDDDLRPHIAALTVCRDTRLHELRTQAEEAGQLTGALRTAAEMVSATVQTGARGALPDDAADAVSQAAADLLALVHALADRNLSQARTVLQDAQERLHDFWDVHGRTVEERRRILRRLRDVSESLAVAASRTDDPTLQGVVDALRQDMDRVVVELENGRLGDALGVLETVERTMEAQLEPSRAAWTARSEAVSRQVGQLPLLVAELAEQEAASLAPDAYGELAAAAAGAAAALAADQLDAAESALGRAGDAEGEVRKQVQMVRATRVEHLSRRLQDVDAAMQDAVGASAGEGAPELLEEGYLEVNAARSLLEESSPDVTADAAGRIEMHLRTAELTAQQVDALGSQGTGSLEAVAGAFAEATGVLEADLARLNQETDYGLGGDALVQAADTLAEAASAQEQQDVARSFTLVRDVDRLLEQVRAERQHAVDDLQTYATFLQETLPSHLAILDDTLVQQAAPDAWEQLCAAPDAAAEALDAQDVVTIRDLQGRALQLLQQCTEAEQAARSRLLVDVHAARAAAESGVRVATLLGAPRLSPDLMAAAAQLLRAGDTAAQARQWPEAQTHYGEAAARAADAQEAALRGVRDAQDAQQDLLRTLETHLAHDDVAGARAALAATAAAVARATPPAVETMEPMSAPTDDVTLAGAEDSAEA